VALSSYGSAGAPARAQSTSACPQCPQPTGAAFTASGTPSGSGLVSKVSLPAISPAYVQQQMGHASIQQTLDTYGSWFPARVPGAVDALAEASSPGGRGHQMDTSGVPAAAQAR